MSLVMLVESVRTVAGVQRVLWDVTEKLRVHPNVVRANGIVNRLVLDDLREQAGLWKHKRECSFRSALEVTETERMFYYAADFWHPRFVLSATTCKSPADVCGSEFVCRLVHRPLVRYAVTDADAMDAWLKCRTYILCAITLFLSLTCVHISQSLCHCLSVCRHDQADSRRQMVHSCLIASLHQYMLQYRQPTYLLKASGDSKLLYYVVTTDWSGKWYRL